MRLRRPLPAVQGDTLHIVGVGDNRIGKVPRPIYDGNGKETGLFTMQHTGLAGYVPMSAVFELMEEVLGK